MLKSQPSSKTAKLQRPPTLVQLRGALTVGKITRKVPGPKTVQDVVGRSVPMVNFGKRLIVAELSVRDTTKLGVG